MKKQSALKLLRGATAVCALLTTVSVGATAIAKTWEPNINEALGTTSTKIVNSEESSQDDLYTFVNGEITTSQQLVDWHKEFAVRSQREGSVLLKNTSNALPLASGAKVTLLGARSVTSVFGGQIGSSPNASQNVTLEAALKDRGFQVNPTTVSAYTKMASVPTGNKIVVWGKEQDEMYTPGSLSNSFGMVQSIPNAPGINEPSVELLKEQESAFETSLSQYNDAAIVVVGRPSSEAADFYPGADGIAHADEFEAGANILGLSINEKAIVDYACTKFSKVIVLVNSDSAMEVDYLKKKDGVSSILWIGAPGNYGFLGVADILKGKDPNGNDVSPSGHLPDTYAVSSVSSPAMVNYGLFKYTNFADYEGNTDASKGFAYLDEKEGIYTGYRYYETRYEDEVLNRYNAKSTKGSSTGGAWSYDNEVSYPFGYGMSYTTFSQEILNVSERYGEISVQVKVKNTGTEYAGKDVVQVYVQTPYTDYDRTNYVEKSAIQLAGFEKTGVLEPNGGEQIVTVTFDKKYIASYDYVNAKTYILDAGDYYLSLGNGAHEALNNVLAKKGTTSVGGDADKVYTWNQDAINTKTYSKGEGDYEITNQFDDMNVNYWTGDKTKLYEGQLSRQDWDTTWPTASSLTATDAMIKELKNDIFTTAGGDTTSTKWGQDTGMKIGSMKGASFDDERWATLLETMTLDEAVEFYCRGQNWLYHIESIGLVDQHVQDGPLGFCYQTLGAFNENEDGDPAAMAKDDPNKDYYINDQVIEPVIAATFNKKLVEEQGELFGTDSLWCNSAVLWGPGLNTHRTPYNGRNHEYYSEDSMLSNYLGAALTKGARKYGLILAPKHFCFNDQETNRTGASVFMNEQRAREIELRAFQGAYDDAGCTGMMTAFNRAGVRFASAHKGLITNVLKNEWGFNGYIVTDMINGPLYMRADTSLLAGTTALDTSNNPDARALMDACKNDPVVQNLLKDAMHHNLWAIANSNALNGVDNLSKVVKVMPWWKATLISLDTIFGVLTGGAIVGYVLIIFLKKDEKEAA